MTNQPTTKTDRHMPLRMNHVVVLGAQFTPLQKRRIALAWNGLVSNKAQARTEGVSIDAIQKTWDSIADTLRLPWGLRSREHTMAELCRRHLVEFICLVLVMLPLLNGLLGDDGTDMRKRRGGRSRRGRYDSAMALDVDTLDEITDWPAWLENNKPSQGGGNMAQDITTALTPIASIALGATTGVALYIAISWPGAGHIGTEITAELAGCAVGLLTHRRANY